MCVLKINVPSPQKTLNASFELGKEEVVTSLLEHPVKACAWPVEGLKLHYDLYNGHRSCQLGRFVSITGICKKLHAKSKDITLLVNTHPPCRPAATCNQGTCTVHERAAEKRDATKSPSPEHGHWAFRAFACQAVIFSGSSSKWSILRGPVDVCPKAVLKTNHGGPLKIFFSF